MHLSLRTCMRKTGGGHAWRRDTRRGGAQRRAVRTSFSHMEHFKGPPYSTWCNEISLIFQKHICGSWAGLSDLWECCHVGINSSKIPESLTKSNEQLTTFCKILHPFLKLCKIQFCFEYFHLFWNVFSASIETLVQFCKSGLCFANMYTSWKMATFWNGIRMNM